MRTLTAVVGGRPTSKHGECFIWAGDVEHAVVAVDAGGSAQVGRDGGGRKPRILVLSHDDHDHIGGAVALIKAARGTLRQLWVPAEWAILVRQVASTDASSIAGGAESWVTLDEVEREVAIQLVIAADEDSRVGLESQLSAAKRNLESWNSVDVNAPSSSQSLNALLHERPPYGARGWSEVLRRVQKRARALIRIFDEAILHHVQIRFFSVDLARELDGRHWESSGQPGVVTIANALEAPHALAVQIPAGIPYAFALTHLTVQNRRALCTLLWTKETMPSPSVLIWSDTDGQWLDCVYKRGFAKVTAKLLACSAPHHASANTAHDRVWLEISAAPVELLVASAGGQHNQHVRIEYDALGANRCCTWCRSVDGRFQEVRISFPGGKNASLDQACLGRH